MTRMVFSIGPVQSFISQSRRTADGWVGSYLLSYLAGHAVAELEGRNARIIEPDCTDIAMYAAIKRVKSGEPLKPGSIDGDTTIAALPNVIVSDPKANDSNTLGGQAKEAAKDAWNKLVVEIKDKLPDDMRNTQDVMLIWDNLTKDPWEFNWAWGATSDQAFKNLSGRKWLRDFDQIREIGDRCTVCGERQALWSKSSKKPCHNLNRDAAKENWGGNGKLHIRGWIEGLNKRDFGTGDRTPENLFQLDGKERLCAICTIKRLIPWTPNKIHEIWMSGSKSSKEPSVFPSTSTMATVLYKAKVFGATDKDKITLVKAINDYYATLEKSESKLGKSFTKRADPVDAFACWQGAVGIARCNGVTNAERIMRLDGDWFLYGEAVKREEDIQEADHKQILKAYRAMCTAGERAGVDHPPIYWALLTMDGDKMGDFIRSIDDIEIDTGLVSQVLNQFALSVPEIIKKYNGRTIFAGGDDVLAFLPLDTALKAADELRRLFFCKFAEWLENQRKVRPDDEKLLALKTSTLSGSIVYAHHQAPLGAVLRSGHDLLTNVAKRQAGRNALVMQQYMRGGSNLTFAAKWTDAQIPSLMDRLNAVIDQLRDREFSSGIFYELRVSGWMFGVSR